MNCQDFDKGTCRIDFLFGDIAQREKEEIEHHLAQCHDCRAELKTLLELFAFLREMPREPEVPESIFLPTPTAGLEPPPPAVMAELLAIADANPDCFEGQQVRPEREELTPNLGARARSLWTAVWRRCGDLFATRRFVTAASGALATAVAGLVLWTVIHPTDHTLEKGSAQDPCLVPVTQLELLARRSGSEVRLGLEPLSSGDQGLRVQAGEPLRAMLVEPERPLSAHPWYLTIFSAEASGKTKVLLQTAGPTHVQYEDGSDRIYVLPGTFALEPERPDESSVTRLVVLLLPSKEGLPQILGAARTMAHDGIRAPWSCLDPLLPPDRSPQRTTSATPEDEMVGGSLLVEVR